MVMPGDDINMIVNLGSPVALSGGTRIAFCHPQMKDAPKPNSWIVQVVVMILEIRSP